MASSRSSSSLINRVKRTQQQQQQQQQLNASSSTTGSVSPATGNLVVVERGQVEEEDEDEVRFGGADQRQVVNETSSKIFSVSDRNSTFDARPPVNNQQPNHNNQRLKQQQVVAQAAGKHSEMHVHSSEEQSVRHQSSRTGVESVLSSSHLQRYHNNNNNNNNNRHHHHIHNHRLHAPTCLAATKLVSGSSEASLPTQAPTHLPAQVRLKQHQPHCVHHNNRLLANGGVKKSINDSALAFSSLDNQTSSTSVKQVVVSTSGQHQNHQYHHHHQHHHRNQQQHFKSQQQQQPPVDKSYLLVQYRPDVAPNSNRNRYNEHQQRPLQQQQVTSSSSSGSSSGKQTTIKFISQLYFLLHLSAILSLLLHHKNLVAVEQDYSTATGERATGRWHPTSDQQQVVQHSLHPRKVSGSTFPALNQSQPTGGADASPPVVLAEQLPAPLPVPLMLHQLTGGGGGGQQQLINSVVPTQTQRFSRQLQTSNNNSLQTPVVVGSGTAAPSPSQNHHLLYLEQPVAAPPVAGVNNDILVRVVGAKHARCALQYFLCYLLSSSVAVLVGLRLFRLCRWPSTGGGDGAGGCGSAQEVVSNSTSANCGFYYRTRLDCTPVLIGSVSLGLIQLIVIGLDVANNINWLSNDNRWPLYLPLLQFAFVSLLMQFILSRVAKNNRSNEDQQYRPRKTKSSARKQVADIRQVTATTSNTNAAAAAVSINEQRKQRSSSNNAVVAQNEQLVHWSNSPMSNGLQNIALAHLLVTHILLWLMKLNSISLFQVIEQEQQQHQQHQQQYRNEHQHQQHHDHHRAHHHRHHHHQQQQQTVSSIVVVAPPNIYLSNSSSGGNKSLLLQPINPIETQSTVGLSPQQPQQKKEQQVVLGDNNNNNNISQLMALPVEQVIEQQHNRSELESMLRRKWPPTKAISTSDQQSGTGNSKHHLLTRVAQVDSISTLANLSASTLKPITQLVADTSRAPLSLEQQVVELARPTTTLLPVRPAPVAGLPIYNVNDTALKNERGLRSAAIPAPLLQATGGNGAGGDSANIQVSADQLIKLLPGNVLLLNKSGPSITLSQGQLLSLLSLAASASASNKATGGGTEQPQVVMHQQQQQQQPVGAINASAALFKSSLPKRMTAFRQSSPSPRLSPTIPPPVVPQSSPAPATSSAATSVRPPKQRVRILVSHSDGAAAEQLPPTSADAESRRRAKQVVSQDNRSPPPVSSTATLPTTATTERPFPSVDSDPLPSLHSTTSNEAAESKQVLTERRRSTTKLPAATISTSNSPVAIPPSTGVSSSTGAPSTQQPPVTSESSSSESEDSSEDEKSAEEPEAEVDLDAMLPEVPNYSEESEQQQVVKGRKSSATPVDSGGAEPLEDSAAEKRVKEPKDPLEEDAFVFNEAASNLLNLTVTTPPPVPVIGPNPSPVTNYLPAPLPPVLAVTNTTEPIPSTNSSAQERQTPVDLPVESTTLSPPIAVHSETTAPNDRDSLPSPLPTIPPVPVPGLDEDPSTPPPVAETSAENQTTASPVAPLPEPESTTAPKVGDELLITTSSPITTEQPPPINTPIPAPLPAASSVEPEPEALAMSSGSRERMHHEQRDQPSFVDYLLPIVHQYHILIIAILFNMWLDSLRAKSAHQQVVVVQHHHHHLLESSGQPQVKRSHNNKSQPQLLNAGNFSSASLTSELTTTSSSTGAASTRQLVAIPIRNDSNLLRRFEAAVGSTTGQVIAAGSKGALALGKQQQQQVVELKRRRSRSMDLLLAANSRQQVSLQNVDDGTAANDHLSTASSLSRYNSLRSSSSERLLWIPSNQLPLSKQRNRLFRSHSSSSHSSASTSAQLSANATNHHHLLLRQQRQQQQLLLKPEPPVHSVCSVFFGLLVVSGSLIVILLDIDLLSLLTQCLTQLVSILVSLVGMLLTWRARVKCQRRRNHLLTTGGGARLKGKRLSSAAATGGRSSSVNNPLSSSSSPPPEVAAKSHRQCFHYLFLLAAYYCGISIALNLTKQHSANQLFSPQVVHFMQRNHLFTMHLSSSSDIIDTQQTTNSSLSTNYLLFLFHLSLALKGLLLIVQVTLQTLLIRSSSGVSKSTRELRQIYTFLMFANLSLWAMEICEQQQQLQQRHHQQQQPPLSATGSFSIDESNRDSEQVLALTTDRYKLVTLDTFSRFAASIVTLSHLYHGLVFMQH